LLLRWFTIFVRMTAVSVRPTLFCSGAVVHRELVSRMVGVRDKSRLVLPLIFWIDSVSVVVSLLSSS